MNKFLLPIFLITLGLLVGGSYYFQPQKMEELGIYPINIADPSTADMAGVELIDGKYRLLTSAVTIIEQLFGRDNKATTWFYIGTADDASGVGSAGDTVTINLPAAVSPIGTVLYPACNVVTTVTSGHTSDDSPETELAKTIVSDFNSDSNCAKAWKAERIKDFSGVFISAKIFNEWGERTSWTLSSTGTTVVTKAFNDIVRRGFSTELSRSPNNPRSGILAIAGTVTTIPGAVGDTRIELFEDGGGSSDLLVNGQGTPVEFTVPAHPTDVFWIQQIRCYGGGNGVKFDQFLSKSGSGGLSNGIEVEIRSEDSVFTFPLIKTTEDFKNKFSTTPGSDFRIDVQSGIDQFIASYAPSQPFPLEPQGTFTTDDGLKITVQDNISSGISSLECAAWGFLREL